MSVIQSMSRLRAAAITIAALLALATQSQAQQKPSANAVATAKEIITTKGALSLFTPLVSGVVEQAKLLFLQQNPNLQKDLNDVAASLRTEYQPRFSEIGDEISRIYATQFTEQELKDLLAFYKSPLGKKLVTAEPQIAEQGLKFAQDWANKLSEEVITRMRAEMKKKGHDI